MSAACGYMGCKLPPTLTYRRCAKHKGKHWQSVRKLKVRGMRVSRRAKPKKRKRKKTR